MKKTLLYIVYDGIENSVFKSQVLVPLIQQKACFHSIHLISFETKHYNHQDIETLIPPSSGIRCIIFKKIPFIGTLSLRYAARHLKKVISDTPITHIVARGPLAGYCAIQAAPNHEIVIQARGLVAGEYSYTHRYASWPYSWIHRLRAWQYQTIERAVYGTPNHTISFQAVSPALADYMITHFGTLPHQITVSNHDIPEPFDSHTIAQWRLQTRMQLGIGQNAIVYCYNGSYKPWQYPEKTIDFFKSKSQEKSGCFLLILTPDVKNFEKIVAAKKIDRSLIGIMHVAQENLYRFLAAADFGILFREPHLINWVSRPTKIGEYRAVGLSIIHNNTIALLHTDS